MWDAQIVFTPYYCISMYDSHREVYFIHPESKKFVRPAFQSEFFCGKCAQFMTTRFFDNHQSPKNLVWKGYFCWEYTISVYICNTVFFLKFMTTLFIIQKSGFEFFLSEMTPSPPLWRISENSTNFGSAGFPYKPLGLGVSNFWRQMYPTDRLSTLAHSSTECKCG